MGFHIGGREKEAADVDTCVPLEKLQALLRRLVVLPDRFQPHAKIRKLLDARLAMADGKRPIDWSAAEARQWGALPFKGCESGCRVKTVSGHV